METMVCIEATLKEDRLQDAVDFLRKRFPETRDYPGCQGITAFLNEDGKTMMFIERWDSQADFKKYLAWRQESGSFAYFSELVVGEMDIRMFEPVDA